MKTKTDGAGTDVAVADGAADESVDFGKDPATLTEVQKAESMPTPVKAASTQMLTEATERLMALVNALRDAKATNAKGPLPPALGREIKAVAGLLQGLLSKFPSGAPAEATGKDQMPPEEQDELEKRMDRIIERATAIKSAVHGTDGGKRGEVPNDLGHELKALTHMAGAACGLAPAAVRKALWLVEAEVGADEIQKEAAGLCLHPDVKTALLARLEKVLDVLAPTLRDTSRFAERDSLDSPLMPDFLVKQGRQMSDDLLGIGLEFGMPSGADLPVTAPKAGAVGRASDVLAVVKTGSTTAAAATATAAGAAAPAGNAAAAAPAAAPAGITAEAIAKAVRDGLLEAFAPLAGRMDAIQAEAKAQGVRIAKMAGATPEGNVIPAGGPKPTPPPSGVGTFDAAEVARRKKAGLWF